LAQLQSVEVTVASSDYFQSQLYEYTLEFGLSSVQQSYRDSLRAQYASWGITPGYRFSTAAYFAGASLAGTVSLSNVSHSVTSSLYRYTYPSSGGVCDGTSIECVIYQAGPSEAPGKSSVGYKIDIQLKVNDFLMKWCKPQSTIFTKTDSWCQQTQSSFSSFGSHVAFSKQSADPAGAVVAGCDTCIGFTFGSRTITPQLVGLNTYLMFPQIFQWYGQDTTLISQTNEGSFSIGLSDIRFVP
jgi:hypothetical protein